MRRRPRRQAAKIILDGVKADRWRILVGKDAEFLDRSVRAAPEDAYSPVLLRGAGQEAQVARLIRALVTPNDSSR